MTAAFMLAFSCVPEGTAHSKKEKMKMILFFEIVLDKTGSCRDCGRGASCLRLVLSKPRPSPRRRCGPQATFSGAHCFLTEGYWALTLILSWGVGRRVAGSRVCQTAGFVFNVFDIIHRKTREVCPFEIYRRVG